MSASETPRVPTEEPASSPGDGSMTCTDVVTALQESPTRLHDDQFTNQVPDRVAQDLLTMAVKLYVAKRDAGEFFPPFAGEDVTATEVVVVATNLLKAANLEVFELTMWNGFGTM